MSALHTGVSGMLAHQARMDSIGNNIANANTVGYKSSRVLFAEAIHDVMQAATAPTEGLGGTNPTSMGMGVIVSGTDRNFSQGNLLATGRSTDIAVQGGGMIAVTDGQRIFYTRDGALGLDSNGGLVHLSSGLRVVALSGDDADPASVSPASTLQVPLGQSLSRSTSEVVLGGNLDSRTEDGEGHTMTARIYDSLGAGHDITVTMTKDADAGVWNVTATSPDGTVTIAAPANFAFDETGKPSVESLALQFTLSNPNGAEANMAMNLGIGNVTQQAQDSSVALRSQDGMAPGTLTGVTFEPDGSIVGVYSNGLRSSLGQLVTARFTNPAGLEPGGSSLYLASANSGIPDYGVPGTDGYGTIASGQLEGSNVNLAQEFSEMIITQRGFQASSRVITTADQMLQELINTAR